METFGVSEVIQNEHDRRSDVMNRQGWKFEHARNAKRLRLKLAGLGRSIKA